MFNGYNYIPFGVRPQFSLFSGLRNLSLGSVLSGTQRTLNVINQAIPLFYQIKPLWNNTKTLFRIANAVNSDEKVNNNTNTTTIKEEHLKEENDVQYNKPVFFI